MAGKDCFRDKSLLDIFALTEKIKNKSFEIVGSKPDEIDFEIRSMTVNVRLIYGDAEADNMLQYDFALTKKELESSMMEVFGMILRANLQSIKNQMIKEKRNHE